MTHRGCFPQLDMSLIYFKVNLLKKKKKKKKKTSLRAVLIMISEIS